HDDSPSLLISVVLLLLMGPCQERRWGSVAFLFLSILTMATLSFIYTLVLFVGGGEASRICGYSATQLALFTAQSLPQFMVVDRAAPPPERGPTAYNIHPWMEPSPAWVMEVQSAAVSEAEVLEEQMLRAGILASLQDAPEEGPDTKVELPKSSVSSLRLVQFML
ncbi:hypothetical protein GOODEAATRI_017109, partial [Goodea atripinnis]